MRKTENCLSQQKTGTSKIKALPLSHKSPKPPITEGQSEPAVWSMKPLTTALMAPLPPGLQLFVLVHWKLWILEGLAFILSCFCCVCMHMCVVYVCACRNVCTIYTSIWRSEVDISCPPLWSAVPRLIFRSRVLRAAGEPGDRDTGTCLSCPPAPRLPT